MRFFNHPAAFFEDKWLSVVDRGLFHTTWSFGILVPTFHFSSRISNSATLKGLLYFDFRSFGGVVASRSCAPTLAELGHASRPPLDDQKLVKVLESLRRRFDGIGFRASYRVLDGPNCSGQAMTVPIDLPRCIISILCRA
jgi:hypothetical protein